MKVRWSALAAASAACLAACAHGRNFDAPVGPLYLGGSHSARAERPVLRVVTFNVQQAHALTGVADVLRESTALRDADLILLQETDIESTAWLARVLHRRYVYVPATWHPVTERDYGNAILSAWPIASTGKILLPHLGRWRRSRRAATAATVCVGSTAVRIYATHLGTVTEIGPGSRRAQLDRVLDDAADYPIAIVGGDFNSGGIAAMAVARGYAWPTADRGATRGWWAIDHVVVRGLTVLDAGVTEIANGVSDHRPVWTTLALRETVRSPPCGGDGPHP